MASSPFSLSEAELHGLVDGHLTGHRRADVLRRAASSPSDRDRIDVWQDQADQIRAAFRSVQTEPLPPALDLRPAPKLHCVPPALVAPANANEPRLSRKGRRVLAGSGTTLVVAAGLAGSWFIGGFSTRAASGDAVPVEVLRDSPDDILARRTEGALAAPGGPMAPQDATVMPTTSIPDLTPVGFTFSGAEAQTGGPASLVFRYQNAAAERIVIGVARAGASSPDDAPAVARKALTWHIGQTAYAIAGTVKPERLHEIAASLRADAIDQ